MRRWAVGLMGVIFLAACGARPAAEAPAAEAPDAQSAAPMVAEQGQGANTVEEPWHAQFVWGAGFNQEGGHLAHCVPESDVCSVQLFCTEGSGRVRVITPPSGDANSITLSSGELRSEVAAERVEDEVSDTILIAWIPAGDPVLSAFAGTGVLAVGVPPEALPVFENTAKIQGFFDFCAGSR